MENLLSTTKTRVFSPENGDRRYPATLRQTAPGISLRKRPGACLCTENTVFFLMFIGPCIIMTVEEWKTSLMSLAISFHFLCARHVSDINISIIRSLRLFCWINTLVVFFLVRCVLEFWCGWLKPATRIPLQTNHTKTPTHIEPRKIRPMW